MLPNCTALHQALDTCGLAILRGIQTEDVASIGRALYDSGFRIIEVPLNSPEPMASIRTLRHTLPPDCVVGAGTVLNPADCPAIAAVGGQVAVMPHSDPLVIQATHHAGLACMAGVATPTEAFAAIAAGATMLKLFPANAVGPATLKAWRDVLPPTVALLPVGGLQPEHLAAYRAAGASGFGLGSALYRPGDAVAQVRRMAERFMQAWRGAEAAQHPPAGPRP
ncbi:MAG: 2-dehydro-3-deoxy-6-phosphogalactonate aldolase [Burkholderiaceae bacterium]